MNKQYELRLGICGCTSSYFGQFDGQILQLRRTLFRIKEIRIDETENFGRSIVENACHFFLDVHKEGRSYHSFLLRYGNPILFLDDKNKWVGCECRDLGGNQPATADQIKSTMLELAGGLNHYQLRKWIAAA